MKILSCCLHKVISSSGVSSVVSIGWMLFLALLWQGDWKWERQQDVFAQSGHRFWPHFASALRKGQQNLKQLTADLHERQLVSGGHGSGKTCVYNKWWARQRHLCHLCGSDHLLCVPVGASPSLLPPAGEHSNTWQQTSKPSLLYWSITGNHALKIFHRCSVQRAEC